MEYLSTALGVHAVNIDPEPESAAGQQITSCCDCALNCS
jgi:hypothetical protein